MERTRGVAAKPNGLTKVQKNDEY